MKRRFLLKLIVIFSMILPLMGCWDMEEIEMRNQVIAMAIDQVGKEHELTIQVPIPTNIVGGSTSTGGGKAVETFSARGNSLAQILTKLQRDIDRRLFLGHLRLVVFGEEMAKKGIHEFLDLLMRSPDVSRKVYTITASGRGKDLLEKSIEMDKINSNYLDSMIRTGVNFGRMVPTSLAELVSDIENKYRSTPVLNKIGLTAKGYRWEGLSLFRKDVKVGQLDVDETTPLLHIREQKEGSPLKIACDNKPGAGIVEFRTFDIGRDIAIIKNHKVRITIEVEGEVIEKTCDIDLTNPRYARIIQNRVRARYNQLARKVINKAQREYKTDIFELGAFMHAIHPDFYRKINWNEDFSKIPIEVDYRVHLRRFGLEP